MAHEGQRCPGHQVCEPVAILRAVQVGLYLLLAQQKIKSSGESKAPPLGPCGTLSSRPRQARGDGVTAHRGDPRLPLSSVCLQHPDTHAAGSFS